MAEGAAEPGGGDDRHALGTQPATLDVGAMHAHQGGGGDTEQAAKGVGFPADGGQGAVEAVVVVPDQSVGAQGGPKANDAPIVAPYTASAPERSRLPG